MKKKMVAVLLAGVLALQNGLGVMAEEILIPEETAIMLESTEETEDNGIAVIEPVIQEAAAADGITEAGKADGGLDEWAGPDEITVTEIVSGTEPVPAPGAVSETDAETAEEGVSGTESVPGDGEAETETAFQDGEEAGTEAPDQDPWTEAGNFSELPEVEIEEILDEAETEPEMLQEDTLPEIYTEELGFAAEEAALGADASAIASGSCGEAVNWVLTEDGTLTISGTGEMSEWTTDASIPWFSWRSYIRTVVIEDGVTTVGKYAFRYCSSLSKVTMGGSVVSIGSYAFFVCSSLQDVTMGGSVAEIGSYAFYNCTSLEKVTIPDQTTVIGSYAFGNCTGLSELTIPDSVLTIDNYAFYNCVCITGVYMGKGVSSIGNYAFSKCSSLTDVYYNGGAVRWAAVSGVSTNTYLKNAAIHFSDTDYEEICSGNFGDALTWSLNGVGDLSISGTGAMPDWTSASAVPWYSYRTYIRALSIKDGVTTIGSNAFYYCTSLTDVTIGSDVTSIGNYAFYNCISLKDAAVPDGVTAIGNYAFYNCTSLASVKFGGNAASIGSYAFGMCSSLSSVKLPDSMLSIGNYAFYNCTGLVSAATGKGVTTIGAFAFYNCTSLASVSVEKGVKTIGNNAFYNCTSLTEVTYGGGRGRWAAISIGSGNTSLTGAAICCNSEDEDALYSGTCGDALNWTLTGAGDLIVFGSGEMTSWSTYVNTPWYYYRNSIRAVRIGEEVTSIGRYSFYGCSVLESAVIGAGVVSIGDCAFYGCGSLASVDLGASVSSLGSHVFYNCTSLSGITLPDSVSAINNYAFYNCSSLSEIRIPDSVSSIGSYAFDNCTNLSGITVPDSVSEIGSYAFYNCSGLTQASIGDGAASIGKYAFYGCSDLTELSIGEKLSVIDGYAFCNCTGLTGVSFGAAVTTVGSYAFYNCSALQDVYYGGGTAGWSAINFNSYNTDLTDADIHYGAEDGAELSSGTCGDGVSWTLTAGGTLTLSGTGAMSNDSTLPWDTYRSCIRRAEVGEGITSIGKYAFYGCSALTSVTIADSVSSIGSYAFRGCTSLKQVDIPAGVTSISNACFYGCTSLGSVSVAEGNSSYTSKDGILYNKAMTSLIFVPANTPLETLTLPDTVASVEAGAIRNIQNLRCIVFPENSVTLGYYAIQSCYSLEKLLFPGAVPSKDSRYASYSFHSFLEIDDATVYCSFSDSAWVSLMEEFAEYPYITWIDLDNLRNVETLEISGCTSGNLQVGESVQLEAIISPFLAMDFVWDSSDGAVASVSSSGRVIALSEGETEITCTSADGAYTARLSIRILSGVETPGQAVTILDSEVVSDNVSDNAYTVYGTVVKSYLTETPDGGLMRVEYVSGTGVVIETFTDDGGSSTVLKCELPVFGGFFSGEDAYFLVFGQNNTAQTNTCEVMRIVKYNKNWERQGEASVYGANTYVPFSSGSLRMAETGGLLFIHTCHKMYTSADGLNHQANMTFVVDEADMEVKDSYYGVMNISYGYVSHSFNQFVCTDGNYVYRVNHGDAYPRAVSITRSAVNGSITKVTNAYPLVICGTTGNNATGVSVGGAELSSDNCLIAGNSVDQSDSSIYSAGAQRNIFLTVTDKSLSNTKLIWLTDYTSGDGITPGTPQLVKLGDDLFLVLWEEYSKSTGETLTKLVTVDGDGKQISQITPSDLRLSDCQPVVTSDGLVKWYVTDGSQMSLCTINPYDLEAICSHILDEGTVIREASCTEEGEKSHTCTLCGKTVEKAIPTVEHTYDGIVTQAATCTATGIKTYTCRICNDTYTETIPRVTEHVWNDGEITREPTCNLSGIRKYTCTICGSTKSETLAKSTEHTYDSGKVLKAAGCTAAGRILYTCSVCGVTKPEVLSATGHSWDDGKITKTPCEGDGEIKYTCTVCGETRTEVLPKAGHRWDDVEITKKASCEEDGEKVYTCTVCGATKTEAIPAAGHIPGEAVRENETADTSTGAGSYDSVVYCSVCGKELSRDTVIIPGTGDNSGGENSGDTPNAGQADGAADENCSHDWEDWRTVSEATVFEPEMQVRSCSVCGETQNRTTGSKLSPTIALNAASLRMQVGQSTKAFKVSGMANGDYVVSVKSNKAKILKVVKFNKSGTIKLKAMKKTGKAKLTITLASGLEKKITVKVQKKTVKTTKISVAYKTIYLKKGSRTSLDKTVLPITSQQKVTYTSSNKKVAAVTSKGVVRAKRDGTAKITVRSGSKKAVVKVKVVSD